VNFGQLEIFNAVMTCGTASRASELLNVSQPAVSRAISDLEYRIGFALFSRVKGRLVPTPEGHLFFREVEESFAGLDKLRAAAARIRDFGSGRIRIASLAAMGSTLVPRAIRRFRDDHPGVAITLQVASSRGVRDLVASGQFDVGLAADEVDLSGLAYRSFAIFDAVCAIPPDHALATKDVIRPPDLDHIDFIALSPEDRARSRMESVFEHMDVRPSVVVETPNSATVCSLALEGVGVGLVNPAAVDGFAVRGLVLRPFEPSVEFRACLLYGSEAEPSKLVADFTAVLEKKLTTSLDHQPG